MKIRLTVYLALFILFGSALSFSQQVNIPLRITDGFGSDTLRFGLDPAATDGIDASLGEFELPPLPPSGVFDTRFIGNDIAPIPPLGQGVKYDYRTGTSSFVGTKRHEISYQVGAGTSIKIYSSFPAGVKAAVSDLLGGIVIKDTLTGTDSLIVLNPGIISKLMVDVIYFPPPGMPTLLLPSNGSLSVGLTPTLDWNDPATATSYRVQVSTDSLFGTTVFDSAGINISQVNIPAGKLNNDVKYYWRVNASNVTGSGAWSLLFNFTTIIAPPAAPVLISPSNNAVNISITSAFDWNDAATATKYWIQVSTNSGFTSFVINDSTPTTSQFTPSTALSNNTQYYWRVYARNINNWGPASTAWNYTTIIAPPLAPVLLSPSNNAVNVLLTPTLDWNDAATATKYRVQLSTNSGFTSFIINDSTLTTSQFTVNPGLLTNNTSYYWRVYAGNINDWSPSSSAWSFTTIIPPPAAPVLVSPANNAVNISVTPTLDWNDAATATKYWVQVSTNSGFTSIIINDSTSTASQFTPSSALLNNTQYYWRVYARNINNWGPASESWSFTTIIAPPSAPVLVSPTNNATNLSLTPTLDWNDAATATKYWVQVSTNSGFSSFVINDSSILASQFAVSSGTLVNGTQYYWRVYARNINTWGSASSVWNFTTIIAPPSAPVLVSPVNNAVNVLLTPMLDWNDVPTATKYWVQLSTNSGFTSFVVNDSSSTVSQFAVGSGLLVYNTPYYWRVFARNVNDWGPVSNTWGFTTIISPPVAPVLTAPENNAVNISLTPTLDWNDVATATKYWVQVSTNSGFTSFVINDSSSTSSSFTAAPGVLTNNTQYHWRVYARNVNTWGPASTAWNFTTIISPPAAPVLISPANNAVNISLTPTLDWNDVSTATKYWVQVSTNSGFTSFIINDSSLTTSQLIVTAGLLTNSNQYYWRVSARNINNWGSPSAAWSFTTIVSLPLAPVLSLPANNSAGIVLLPLFDWNDVVTATNYKFQLSPDSLFASLTINDSSITSSQYQTAVPLSYNTKYWWRVYAKNIAGISPSSGVFNFTTAQIAGTPVLQIPLNNAVNVNMPFTADWNDITGATKYQLVISTDSLFSAIVLSDTTLTSSQRTINLNELNYLTKYWWKVRAKDVNGYGAYSAPFSFTTIIAPPIAPVLVSPANNSTGITLTPLLDWDTVASATKYWIQLSTDSMFTSTLINDSSVTATQFTVSTGTLLNNTKYYWRVYARNLNTWGASSVKFNFTTIGLPVAPVLISPLNNGIISVPSPLLDWSVTPFASSYRVQIADSTGNFSGSNLIMDSVVAVDSIKVTGLLQNSKKYYWRVAGKNSLGQQGQYSAEWNFRIVLTGITMYSLELPKEFKLHNNFPNPFNPSTKIRFDLPKNSGIRIVIFDISGREIARLVDKELMPAGAYEYEFNASRLASGVYFYRMETKDYVHVKRMVLVK